jgi:hypothetical protein
MDTNTTCAQDESPTTQPDEAVDDTEDVDDEYVDVQKSISNRRRPSIGNLRVQEILPFTFSPHVRPLTISDLESCVALENAAFSDPAHRCSREKVSW